MSDLSEKSVKNSSDESPASVPQTVPTSDHPHLKWMRDEISEEFNRRGGGNGGGGNMSDLERRVGNLETDVRAIRDNLHTLVLDVAVIKSNYASKSDISDLKTEISGLKTEITGSALKQTMWTIGTVITVAGMVIAVQRFIPPASNQTQVIPTQAPMAQYAPVQNQTGQYVSPQNPTIPYAPAQSPVMQNAPIQAQTPENISQATQQKSPDH
ncbi:hypothetical protein [Methylobacter luteus]|uniref:hypothetical protein n=1 Tax=Methylobacter luteus TaxID=415 RepID=UPI000561FFF5|nr:hypothetical protein [Methylobacter luteus]